MIRLRSAFAGRDRRWVVLASLGMLCAALVLAHSAFGMGHDGEPGAGDHLMQDTMAMCLAIAEIGTAVLLVTALWTQASRVWFSTSWRPRPLDDRRLVGVPPCSRAGPAMLQVFRR